MRERSGERLSTRAAALLLPLWGAACYDTTVAEAPPFEYSAWAVLASLGLSFTP